jgi:transcriptional regulator with XRE-family HTH domain
MSSKEPSITRFGEKLRYLRTLENLTLQQLAERLDLHAHGYLSELENGKKLPTVELTLKVAKLFNVSTDELLRDDLEIGRRNAD